MRTAQRLTRASANRRHAKEVAAQGRLWVPDVLRDEYGISTSYAAAAIGRGDVTLDGERLDTLSIPRLSGAVIQLGQRKAKTIRP